MKIETSVYDFVNSKFHSERVSHIDGPAVRNLRRSAQRIELCMEAETRLKQPLVLIWTGAKELMSYFTEELGIEQFGDLSNPTTIDFGDFKVYGVHEEAALSDLTNADVDLLFLNVTRVWLPRKTELTIKYLPYTYYIEDRYLFKACIFPGNLMYPEKSMDLKLFAQYLRLHGRLPYKITYKHRILSSSMHIRKFPEEDWMGYLVPKSPEIFSGHALLEAFNKSLTISLQQGCDISDEALYLPMIDITQKDIDKFVSWSNNRYSVIIK